MRSFLKKISLAVVVCAFSASMAVAHDSTGCGLGSLAWKGEKGKFPQILAVTTNNFFGTQTFGISSGTSGCDPEGRITGGTGKMALAFIENNMEQFALDVAKGEGETIETLAGILNVNVKVFGEKTKNNFAYIFESSETEAVDVTLKVLELFQA